MGQKIDYLRPVEFKPESLCVRNGNQVARITLYVGDSGGFEYREVYVKGDTVEDMLNMANFFLDCFVGDAIEQGWNIKDAWWNSDSWKI